MLAMNQENLDHAKQSATDILKTSKRVIQKTATSADDMIFVLKLLIKLQGFKKFTTKIIQRQLQMSMIKKHLKNYVCF